MRNSGQRTPAERSAAGYPLGRLPLLFGWFGWLPWLFGGAGDIDTPGGVAGVPWFGCVPGRTQIELPAGSAFAGAPYQSLGGMFMAASAVAMNPCQPGAAAWIASNPWPMLTFPFSLPNQNALARLGVKPTVHASV